MVQYGEIKALEEVIKAFECNWVTPEKIIPAVEFLKKIPHNLRRLVW